MAAKRAVQELLLLRLNRRVVAQTAIELTLGPSGELRSKLLRSARSRPKLRSALCSSSTRRRREFTDAQAYEAPA